MTAPTFAIIVAFDLAPGQRDRFLHLVRANAATSVAVEPGCHRFDVLVPETDDRVVLYEIYTDRAAFDAHLATSHYNAFDQATKDLVKAKTISRFTLFEHSKAVVL
jgi:(4S)-4-hydroxy-5-phosphonooxypentane-2,3-dione isomerase